VLVLVLAVLMVSYASSMRAYLEQRQHLSDLRASIASSESNIAALQKEKERWEDPSYVEAQARERFGWVMPGEIGYRVLDEDGKPLGGGGPLEATDVPSDTVPPAWWATAWGSVVAAGLPPKPGSGPAEEIRAPRLAQQP
jgi:cell division protein FtsB